jgi:uncharacterized protein (TIGR00299 family) protein
MKILYFDTIGGLSGDMALGALVNAGVPLDALSKELLKLNVPGFELAAHHIERSGIVATKVDVVISAQPQYHCHLKDIEAIVDHSGLSDRVKTTSKKIFREIALAEAKVHNTPIDKVHFHEVGALDSLVDIVGVSICLEYLNIDAVYSSPMKVGRSGLVNSQHGKLPVPTPATMEILKGYPIVLTEIPYELTTPTGAAIVKALSLGVLSTESMSVERIGYGAGTREIEHLPNLLRAMIGELNPDHRADEVVSIETNIDDMNPEIYPYVIERVLAAGAHDAYIIPVQMKKGRPGIVLSVLVDRVKMEPVLSVLFRETTTLGVRIQPVERRKLRRELRQVRTSLGVVNVKVVIRDGREEASPEYEDCRLIALERGMPLIEVMRIVEGEIERR